MDYKKGQIYTIRSHQTDLFYIGSTCSPLAKRLHNHRKDYKYWLKNNERNYLSSYEIIKFDDHYIELLEDFPCENKKQLNKREGQHIRFYDDKCVNKVVIGRTKAEHYQDNKIEIDNKNKIYYESHKEEITQYIKNYKQEHKVEIDEYRNCCHNCECGGKFTYINKQRHLNSIKHQNYISNIYINNGSDL
jgi:hypothetical protein